MGQGSADPPNAQGGWWKFPRRWWSPCGRPAPFRSEVMPRCHWPGVAAGEAPPRHRGVPPRPGLKMCVGADRPEATMSRIAATIFDEERQRRPIMVRRCTVDHDWAPSSARVRPVGKAAFLAAACGYALVAPCLASAQPSPRWDWNLSPVRDEHGAGVVGMDLNRGRSGPSVSLSCSFDGLYVAQLSAGANDIAPATNRTVRWRVGNGEAVSATGTGTADGGKTTAPAQAVPPGTQRAAAATRPEPGTTLIGQQAQALMQALASRRGDLHFETDRGQTVSVALRDPAPGFVSIVLERCRQWAAARGADRDAEARVRERAERRAEDMATMRARGTAPIAAAPPAVIPPVQALAPDEAPAWGQAGARTHAPSGPSAHATPPAQALAAAPAQVPSGPPAQSQLAERAQAPTEPPTVSAERRLLLRWEITERRDFSAVSGTLPDHLGQVAVFSASCGEGPTLREQPGLREGRSRVGLSVPRRETTTGTTRRMRWQFDDGPPTTAMGVSEIQGSELYGLPAVAFIAAFAQARDRFFYENDMGMTIVVQITDEARRHMNNLAEYCRAAVRTR
jgi:hypothetical protein